MSPPTKMLADRASPESEKKRRAARNKAYYP